MNKARMQQLIDMLDEVEAGTWHPSGPLAPAIREYELDVRFDMAEWGEPDDPDDVGVIACGFSACAVGHMLCDARFQDQGFHDLDQRSDLTVPLLEGFAPRYGSERGFQAAAVFFDIPLYRAQTLFDPDRYDIPDITPGMVRDRAIELLTKEQNAS